MNKTLSRFSLLSLLLCSTVLATLLTTGCPPAAPEPLDPFVYEILPPDGDDAPPTAALRDRAIAALERRRDAFGWDKAKITFTPDGDTRIVFWLPEMPEKPKVLCLAALAVTGHFSIHVVAPENDAWIASLFEAHLAPEGFECVSSAGGLFWKGTSSPDSPNPDPDELPDVITNFAVRPGFEIHMEPGTLKRPWYVSVRDASEPAVQTASRQPLSNGISTVTAVLAHADRPAYAAIAADPETGMPRRLAICFDRVVLCECTPTRGDIRDGVVRFELPSPLDEVAEIALRSGPLPCRLREVESSPSPTTP